MRKILLLSSLIFMCFFATRCQKSEQQAVTEPNTANDLKLKVESTGTGVTFYQNTNYGGTAGTALTPGYYTTAQLTAKGIPDNWASSALVPDGLMVSFWDNDNYTGTSWQMFSDTPDFTTIRPGVDATHKMSSCKVEYAADFFQDINYGGTKVALPVGNYTSAQLTAKGLPDNWASSVKVPAGMILIVFQNDNFTGNAWTITSNTPDFTSLSPSANDAMTSCRVELAPGIIAANPVAKTGYTLTEQDEFSGTTLDTTLWIPYYFRQRSNILSTYEVKNGNLYLELTGNGTSSVQTMQKQDWVVNGSNPVPTITKFTQQYGYFEVRAQTQAGSGYCSSIWLVGDYADTTHSAELDILENPGNSGVHAVQSHIHNWHDHSLPTPKDIGMTYTATPDLTTSFNIYATEWTPTQVYYYFNNVMYYSLPRSPNYKMGFILSFYRATGAWFGTADPADITQTKSMVIDYFRAYSKNP